MRINIPEVSDFPKGIVSDVLPIVRVLYEAEIPILYLTRTEQGQTLLAFVAEEGSAGTFTILAPISASSLSALERGYLSVRDALTASWMWLHLNDPEQSRVWTTSATELPDGVLPLAGTPLLPEHEPVLRTRAVGEQVVLGSMPASVVAFVADSTRKAMKIILDFLEAAPAAGRPREDHRVLYDLPIQSFAFASFELGFSPPDEGLFPREQIREAARRLERGLTWASEHDDRPLVGDSDEERETILRAALLLTPPLAGPIAEIQVSGTWLTHGKVRLSRDSRRRVRKELRRLDSERVVSYQGRIGELDIDNLSFILRDTEDEQDRRGLFEVDLLDDVMEYFRDAIRVAVAGIERQGKLYVSAVAPTKSPPTVERR